MALDGGEVNISTAEVQGWRKTIEDIHLVHHDEDHDKLILSVFHDHRSFAICRVQFGLEAAVARGVQRSRRLHRTLTRSQSRRSCRVLLRSAGDKADKATASLALQKAIRL